MRPAPSPSPRRYLAVWFPFLSSDRLRREDARQAFAAPADAEPVAPVVLVEKIRGALRLAALNPAAGRLGLTRGMTLADAQARTPDLKTVVHRPDADATLLAQVLDDFGRFTPMAATDGDDALILDVTGCTHLFGDEAGLVRAVQGRAGRIGLAVRTALAGTPQAARALARFGPGGVFEPGQDRSAVRALPIAALELDDKELQALTRAGLRSLGDLDDRPTAPLAARFGTDLPVRLGRILGQEDVRITPLRPAPPCVVDRILFEPITETTDVEAVIGDLLVEGMAWLDQRRLGGRAFEVAFFRLDGATRRITVRTGRATRDAPGVMRLFRERLAALSSPLDPGFGFDQLRLSVPVTQSLAPTQGAFEAEAPGTEDLDRLIDRLTARLGPEAVSRFEPVESHLPERAARLVWAGRRQTETPWPPRDPESPPLRPFQMFDPPQPIETVSLAPDGPPAQFRWRRVTHQVARAEGPERIGGEWWRRPGHRTRDYYRVEDRDGRRFWLFRAGFYGEEPEPRWYIHGLFA
ncbi:nucleotidyltransferase [Brevundimonas sp. LM2]|uniref:Y-family DNA polymerase n=1 Tax=Brevundimonas sp. LM2 TaxID=1938605 RepID=UPI000983C0A7|nr:DNA polymerase Y family protein [Brevundimonas sp. LM2]AQR61162.1 nucleotidyltransferase [Brevundimonas sp. LM2]